MDMLDQPFTRGDYKELVNLVLLYLSDNGADCNFTGFNRPGALHKARWMAKMIYTLKIDLLGCKIIEELPKGAVFAVQQQQKIQQFVQFFVFCYIPWWITAPIPSRAPANDVMLIESLQHYRSIDSICADAAMKTLDSHTWYLTEELVTLSLFSGNVDNEKKKEMVEKIMINRQVCSKRFGSGYGKPKCPKVPRTGPIDLTMFVGDDSWSLFEIMKIYAEGFITKPIEDWPLNDEYTRAKSIVENLHV